MEAARSEPIRAGRRGTEPETPRAAPAPAGAALYGHCAGYGRVVGGSAADWRGRRGLRGCYLAHGLCGLLWGDNDALMRPQLSGHLNLWLFYAAVFISRYSSMTSCGAR